MSKFIIYSRQRSGTTVLGRTIDQHPEVVCMDELFYHIKEMRHPDWHFPFIQFGNMNTPLLRSGLQIPWGLIRTHSFLKEFYQNNLTGDIKATGFKLMMNQARIFPVTKWWLRRKDIQILILIRENPLDIVISEARAKQTGHSHNLPDEEKNTVKMTLQLKNLVRDMEKVERDNRKLRSIAERSGTCLLTYDELLHHWDVTLEKVFQFLGVTPQKLTPVHKKRGAVYLEDNVENHQEVTALLTGTRFASFIRKRPEIG